MEAETNAADKEKDRWIAQSPKLPDEVVFDILSRLPVQCLLQYRCVCKSWLSMISEDPQFIKTHLHRSTKSDSQRLLLASQPSHCYFRSIACEFPDQSPKILQYPLTNPLSHTKLLCSCDGLILLSVSHKPFSYANSRVKFFVLWNPSIRAYKEFWCPYDECTYGALHGICYDSNIDDYRVVIVSQNFETFVLIYNPESNTWNRIKEPCYSILSLEKSGVLVNEALHWVMASKKLGSWVIVYFDLVEAKLKEVPRLSFGGEETEIDLVVLRECLCVYRCMDREMVEIWAMKEYGREESRAKLIVIPNLIDFRRLKPLYFTKNGEVLIEVDNRKTIIYDPEDSKFRNVRSYGDFNCFRSVAYVESLVFLNSDGEVRRQHQAYPGSGRRKMKGRYTQK